jgi:replication factor C subunit 3/5
LQSNLITHHAVEHRNFKTSTNKPIDIITVGSSFHIECNPSDVGNDDRFVIQEVIKEIASCGNVTTATESSKSFKIVVLTEVDKLSKQAQAGLRRTMEK